MSHDAIVIGAGQNGLVAANVLADHGWSVLVLEEQDQPGGAVRTAELTLPGFRHDVFSSFYPLGVASPVMRSMELERWGLRWCRSELVLAHPTRNGRAAAIHADPESTAAAVEEFAAGDGEAWLALWQRWQRVWQPLTDALFATPFPPVRAAGRLARAVGPKGLADFTRFGVLSARRLTDECFSGDGATRLVAGNTLHADFTMDAAGGGFFGFLLAFSGQQFGYPVPEGGAQSLTCALIARLRSNGGEVRCGERVEGIAVERGRARGVTLAGGERVSAGRAVIADVNALALYKELLPAESIPASVGRAIRRFEPDAATVKVDWALDGPIPWESEVVRRSACVHIGEAMTGLSTYADELARGLIPREPFLVMGQYSMADPTRQPEGKDTAWAYTHVPQKPVGDAGGELTGSWDEREADAIADRVEAQIEAVAPGFRKLIAGRHVLTPPTMQAANRALVGGAINGGTAQLHQQLIFRPFLGTGRPETPVRGLFLGSNSAHPGGGVHGACGANAARAALIGAGTLGGAAFRLNHAIGEALRAGLR